MRGTILSIILSLHLAFTIATPIIEVHRVHEFRQNQPHGWTRVGTPHADTVLPMQIALAQSNLHLLDELHTSVSYPDSAQYGQHWSIGKVATTFAPSSNSFNAVSSWLKAHDIATERISHSQSKGWLNLNLTVKEAEKLMKTEYTLWQHETTGKSSIACDHYHVPEHLVDHVGMLGGVLRVEIELYADLL